jgi:prepilin-type N-terminal cleavage/methylation domain-containing protein
LLKKGVDIVYKKGFTLIELLVVVLIIGILSAVALTQYNKATLKAKAAQYVMMARLLSESEKRYLMANGTYTTKLEDLDIEYNDFTYCGDSGGYRHYKNGKNMIHFSINDGWGVGYVNSNIKACLPVETKVAIHVRYPGRTVWEALCPATEASPCIFCTGGDTMSDKVCATLGPRASRYAYRVL